MLGYFDTSALMRWAESHIASPRDINARLGPEVQKLLDNEAYTLAISEITLIEYRANVARAYRTENTDAQFAGCDAGWAQAARTDLMQLIAQRRLMIIDVPNRAAEEAIGLLDLIADKGGGAIGVWDVMHLLSATRWAYNQGEPVELFTSDPDYEELFTHYGHFARFVTVVKLQDLAPGATAP
jgi:hypothetical protein